MKRGEFLESEFSKRLHSKGIPLLISPGWLRSFGCGQIDIAILYKKDGEYLASLFEVKSQSFVSSKQQKRLYRSAHLLSQLFGWSVQLRFLDKTYLQN